jgi:MFS family permease
MRYRNHFQGQLSALSQPQYRRYWLGSFASVGATQLMVMGQGWLVYELSGSAMQLGLLGAAASIPAILMTLFGGAIADRMDKQLVLKFTSVLVGALLLLLALLDVTGMVTVWQVLLIAALIAFVSGIDWPTRQAIFPLLIKREHMMSAVALNSIIWQSTRMIMPAVGGIVIAFTDTWVVFLLCASGFFIMFLVVAGLKFDSPKNDQVVASTFGQILEGIKFIANNQLFTVLIALSYAGMFFGYSYLQLMPAFADLLGTDSSGYGYLISASGFGAVAGTVITGFFQRSRRLGVVMLAASALAALLVYLFAAISSLAANLPGAYLLALLTVFSLAACSSVFMITSLTVLQLHVPNEIRGRVMGIHGITYSMIPLGGLLAGWIATIYSAPIAIGVSATIYLLIVLWIAATKSAIRNIDGRALQPGE